MVFSVYSINSTDRHGNIPGEDNPDDYHAINAVNHADGAATGAVDVDIDIDYPLEVPCQEPVLCTPFPCPNSSVVVIT
jgi:hypothetical protein